MDSRLRICAILIFSSLALTACSEPQFSSDSIVVAHYQTPPSQIVLSAYLEREYSAFDPDEFSDLFEQKLTACGIEARTVYQTAIYPSFHPGRVFSLPEYPAEFTDQDSVESVGISALGKETGGPDAIVIVRESWKQMLGFNEVNKKYHVAYYDVGTKNILWNSDILMSSMHTRKKDKALFFVKAIFMTMNKDGYLVGCNP